MVRNPTKIALETLQNLDSNSAPPRGTPFPKVPGPKKDDKVFLKIEGLRDLWGIKLNTELS